MTDTAKRTPARPLHTASGKDAWRNLIAARLPASKVYVEPVAQEAAVFWSKDRSDVEVLADDDRQIVAFYKWLRDASDAAHNEMREKLWTWDSVHFEKLAKSPRPRKKTDDAYRTKYLHLYSVKNDGITLDSSDAARKRTGKSFVAGLAQYRKRLEGVKIVLSTAADVLSKYDSPDTLFYLDAPDVEDLAESLDALQGKAIIATSGAIKLSARWTTAEIQRAPTLGARKRQLAMNFDPGADSVTTKSTSDCDDTWFTSGRHIHNLDRDKHEACMGGWHAHMYLVDGSLVQTNCDGEHRHYLDGDVAFANTTAHQHEIRLGGLELTTELDGLHAHEITALEYTGLNGAHQHELVLSPDKRIMSLTPATFWDLFRRDRTDMAKGAPVATPTPTPTPTPTLTQLAPYPCGPLQVALLSKANTTLIAIRGQDFTEAWQLNAKAEPGALFERILGAHLVDDVTGAQLVAKGQAELGLVTHELRELFIQMDGSFSGHVVIEHDAGGWQVQLSKRTPPLVTHAKTLDIPLDPGTSALPSSIQNEIPETLQFWKCTDAHTMALSRRALATAGIGPVRVVNKRLTRVEISLTKAAPLMDPDGRAHQVGHASAMQIACSAVGKAQRVIPARIATAAPIAKLVAALASESSSYLVEWPDSADARASLLRIKGASVWRVRGDDKIYVSSSAPHPSSVLEILGDSDTSAALAAKGLNSLKIHAVKDAKMDAERFVLGIVLAPTTPDTADLQNDWYTAEEIRKACHYYMEHHAHVGWHHHAIVDGKIKILENYVALADFETTTADGKTIKILAGTWIMGFRVVDERLWADTLASIGGLSIGGWAKNRSAA